MLGKPVQSCCKSFQSRLSGKEREATLAGIAFAELITYIEDTRDEETLAPVFKLVDLTRLYSTRLQQLGVETKVHSTRLKQRILGQIPDMRAYPKGRDTLLVFDADIGLALTKACERGSDSDAIHLARAAQIVRRHMFHKTSHFDGSFGDNCQEASVPDVLLALINMILEGPSIKEQSRDPRCQAALSMAQLLKFNSVKSARKATDIPKPVKHSREQETPLSIYLGLKLHAETRKKKLVDKLFHLGLSISYDRVLQISADLGNAVNQFYRMENVVCPPRFRQTVF